MQMALLLEALHPSPVRYVDMLCHAWSGYICNVKRYICCLAVGSTVLLPYALTRVIRSTM